MTSSRSDGLRLVFSDDFDGPDLDTSVWLRHYLPAWSSRAETAATYTLEDSCLHLTIPTGQGLWCAGDHTPSLRVSGIQSGNFSGPIGSTVGQQPYRSGLTVAEEQETFWGLTPDHGYLELLARGVVSQRSMVACWLAGIEDSPERCAEICVTEMFGDAVVPATSAAVGLGLHAFRDPTAREDFEAVRLAIDITQFHTYAIDWNADRVDFLVDDDLVRTCAGPPTYPMQIMLAVFDFPDRVAADVPQTPPSLVVDHLRVYQP